MIGPYRVGDTPTAVLRVEIERDGYDADLSVFSGVTVNLTRPTGYSTPVTAAIDGATGDVLATLPLSHSLFTAGGIYSLDITLTSTEGYRESAPPVPFVVEQETGWHTLSSLRAEWADAPDDDVQAYRLLEIAKGACLDFLDVDEDAPTSSVKFAWREAQRMQARNLWNAARVSSDGSYGDGVYAITPRPLDWAIKQLLRPNRGPLNGIY